MDSMLHSGTSVFNCKPVLRTGTWRGLRLNTARVSDLLYRDVSTSDNRQSSQNIELSKLNIINLNVCCLKPKLKLLDFEEFIQKYKLIFLTKTKLDELDDVTVPNYKIFTNNRKIKRRASGGVAVLVHNSLSDYITVLDTDIKSTIWIRLDKSICQIPIVFGLIYNPPENSPYADISIFDQIENTIVDIISQNSNAGISLLGDFNARTGVLSDRMESINTKYEDGHVMLDNDDASCTTSQSGRLRSNSDKIINQMGRRLIDMCRSLNLHMLNGRYGADNEIGKPTCKNSSTVDYIII